LYFDDVRCFMRDAKAGTSSELKVRLRQQRIHAEDCQECDQSKEGFVHRIERAVSFEGDLTEEQRARLREIAHKCPRA